MRRPLIVLLTVGVVVVATIASLLAPSRAKPPSVSAVFLRYTNTAPNVICAAFRIRNESRTRIERSGQCLLVCSLNSEGPGIIDLTGLRPVWKVEYESPSIYGHASTLLPSQEEALLVCSPPADRTNWCVTFTFSRENTKREKRSYAIRDTLFTVGSRLGLRHLVEEPQGLRPVFFSITVHDISPPLALDP